MSNNYRVLGLVKDLAETRRAWNLPVEEIAFRIECAPNTLQKYECGMRLPCTENLIRWADVLGFELALKPKEDGPK